MRKRIWKKKIKKMNDTELTEHTAYCDNKRLRVLFENEFDKRFRDEIGEFKVQIESYWIK